MRDRVESNAQPAIRAPWNLAVAAALCAVWLLLSLSRLYFEIWPGSSAWYPPAALVAAACIVWGGRALLPLVAGGFLAALFSGSKEPLLDQVAASFLVKAAYWLGAVALRRLGFDPSFSRPRHVALFTLVMAGSGLLAALCGVGSGVFAGSVAHEEAGRAIVVFWLGDLMAVLALTPVLLAGAQLFDPRRPRKPSALYEPVSAESVLQVLSLPATLLFAFFTAPRLGVLAFGVGFIPLGWIAITRGVAGATVMSAALDTVAVASRSWTGTGAVETLEMQTLIASLAITGLLLGTMAGERERARTALAESEERYRVLVELLPDPLLVHRDGRILFANAAAARTLGAATPAQLIGGQLDAMATPESREPIQKRVAALTAGQPVGLTEHRLNKLDGSGVVAVESVSIPIDFDGRRAALTVARDVTASRRLAEELRHAQRLESVGQLAGGVAHDFNNLLTVILSCSELLLQKLPEAPLREAAQDIFDTAERGAALTRQLLIFGGRRNVEKHPVRLDQVALGAEKLLTRLISPPVRMRFACAETFELMADPGQLEQVIVNLAVNARDAMPTGGELTIETGTAQIADGQMRWAGIPPGEYATLFVRDTGQGMSAQVREHIFEPFFTTKPSGQGTGLGLATVYGIVKQANGYVFVESEPGKGALFAVFLPRSA
ncbi:MAG TPA: MASE1 domain-containing protein [Myxococcales bacterium]|nr:MASE1 domain-containing protein [Myxococcales bacterium]